MWRSLIEHFFQVYSFNPTIIGPVCLVELTASTSDEVAESRRVRVELKIYISVIKNKHRIGLFRAHFDNG